MLPIVAGLALGVVGAIGWGMMRHGSLPNAILATQGVRLIIEPVVYDLGVVANGADRGATFTVRNLSGQTAQILGAGADCSCVATDGLPLDVPPHSFRTLTVKIHLDGKPAERIDRKVTYYSEKFPRRAATVSVVAHIKE